MKYRPEIDGLRAVAVVPVILFHAGVSLFSGGYVGVDVFFVISGYLITTILINDLEAGKFSILTFYERRARRILPALFFVMACCLPFAWAWMMPAELGNFARSLIAVSFFVSNIVLWREEGYFEASAEEKPLLHTWSLAVEEQYYLLFPVFLALAWRFGRNPTFWCLTGFAAISLALSEWGWRHYPSANFYLAPTRAWELFAGSIAAFLVTRHGVRRNEAGAALGLAGIVLAILVYDADTPFPSVYALLPVGGTVLIILFADPRTWTARLLASKGFVAIGLISYSAYLWHQPLFAFARIRATSEPGLALMLGLAGLTLVLAWFSWRFVEGPFRKGPNTIITRRAAIFAASLTGMALFSALGWTGYTAHGFPNRLSPEQRAVLDWQKFPRDAPYKSGTCFMTLKDPQGGFDPSCVAGRNTVIWGDSFAAALTSGWRLLDPEVGQMNSSACPALLGVYLTERPQCQANNAYVLDAISAAQPAHVVLHANWSGYAKHLEALDGTLAALNAAGIANVTIIGGTPLYQPTLPQRLIANELFLETPARVKSNITKVRQADALVRAAADRHGARFIPVVDQLCDSHARCDAVIAVPGGFEPVAWDVGHLTPNGARYILNKLALQIPLAN